MKNRSKYTSNVNIEYYADKNEGEYWGEEGSTPLTVVYIQDRRQCKPPYTLIWKVNLIDQNTKPPQTQACAQIEQCSASTTELFCCAFIVLLGCNRAPPPATWAASTGPEDHTAAVKLYDTGMK